MSKTVVIARHEFTTTIRRKAFILLTLAFPVIVLLGLLASELISGLGPSAPKEREIIGYVDGTGLFTETIAHERISLQPFATPEQARAALLNGDVKQYFVVPADYLDSGLVQRFTLEREIETSGETQAIIRDFLLGNLLKGKASPDLIARVKSPLSMVSTTLTETGAVAPNQGGFAGFIVPYIFSILLLMAIFFSSGYLLQGLGEEKENRVMEVLLSSVSSKQLLAGKVLGLGAAGLVQIIIWLASVRVLANIATSQWGDAIGALQIPAEFLVLGAVYFVLGYLFYAVLMAGVGAISPTAREGQQMSALFTMPAVIPMWFMPFIIENPNHVVSRVLTVFPVTAPITVMIRFGLTEIPLWEIAVSIGLLAASTVGLFLLCARVFRTFLLMYGKRPGLREIVRSFRRA